MTWTAHPTIVTNSDTKASSSNTVSGAQQTYLPVVGDVVYVIFAADNVATVNGDSTNHNSCVDSKGNTYFKIREYTNAQGAANAGATLSLWVCLRVLLPWDSATTVTISHTATTGRTIRVHAFTPSNGNGGILDPTTAFNVGTAADPASFSLTPAGGNRAYLWLYGLGAEGPSGDTDTADTGNGWTRLNFNGTSGSTAATNMTCVSAYQFTTAASVTVNWTHTATDHVQILAAIMEAPAVMVPTPTWLDSFAHQQTAVTSYGTNAGVYDSVSGGGSMTFPPGRRSGAVAIQIVQNGSTAGRVGKFPVAGTRVDVESFYIRIPALPTTDSNFWNGVATISAKLAIVAANGNISYTAGTGTAKLVSGNWADGQWHRIDLRFVTQLSLYTLDLSVDGVAYPQHVSNSTTAADITETRLGSGAAVDTLTFQVQDWVRSATAQDYPIGPHICGFEVAASDGTHSWAGTNMGDETGGKASSATDLWQAVASWPAVTSAFIQYANLTATATEYAEIQPSAPAPGAAVWAARAVAAIFSGGTAANAATTRVVDGSGATVLDLYVGDQSDTSLRHQATMIPGITSRSLLNALKWRVGFPTDSNPAPQWAGLLIDYVYPEVVVPSTPASGDSKGYSTAVGDIVTVAATVTGTAAAQSHGSGQAVASVITSGQGVGWSRGRARTIGAVIEALPTVAWARGRAAALGQNIATGIAAARSKGFGTALPSLIRSALSVAWSRGRAAAVSLVTVSAPPEQGRSKGRSAAVGSATTAGQAAGWSHGRGASPQGSAFVPAVTVTGQAQAWSRGRAQTVTSVIAASQAQGRSRGRATALGSATVAVQGVGRSRGRAAAVGSYLAAGIGTGRSRSWTTSVGTRVQALPGVAWARGRAAAVALAVTGAVAAARSKGRAAAVPSPLPMATAAGWSRGRGTAAPATVTASGTAFGQSRGRGTAVAAPQTTTGAPSKGWAKARIQAQWTPPGIQVSLPGLGRAKARATALGAATVTGIAVGRSRARATAVPPTFTATGQAVGRARGRSAAAWTALGVIASNPAVGYAHGRATSVPSPVAVAQAVGRARSRSLSIASLTALGLGHGRSHGRGTAGAVVFAPPPVTSVSSGHAHTWTHAAEPTAHSVGAIEAHGHSHSWSRCRIVLGVQDTGRKVLVLVG